jgi:hypothetical protein
MKKLLSTLFVMGIFLITAQAQKSFSTSTAQVKFNASTAVENVRAVNNQGESRWLESSGQIVFSVLIKGFKFENQLMEQHFNEDYLQSEQFPKAEFKGYINDIQNIDITKAGGYNISAEGTLTIHGVSKKINVLGVLTVLSSGKIMLKADIKIKLKDYNILGSNIGSKIATEASIYINCMYE